LTMTMVMAMVSPMERVSKSMLKAKMLEYFRRVEETGEELVVTDNNEPVIRIVPIRKVRPASEVFADVRGGVVYHDDLLAPTTDEWGEG
jgi:prevent-host-death family protein